MFDQRKLREILQLNGKTSNHKRMDLLLHGFSCIWNTKQQLHIMNVRYPLRWLWCKPMNVSPMNNNYCSVLHTCYTCRGIIPGRICTKSYILTRYLLVLLLLLILLLFSSTSSSCDGVVIVMFLLLSFSIFVCMTLLMPSRYALVIESLPTLCHLTIRFLLLLYTFHLRLFVLS